MITGIYRGRGKGRGFLVAWLLGSFIVFIMISMASMMSGGARKLGEEEGDV